MIKNIDLEIIIEGEKERYSVNLEKPITKIEPKRFSFFNYLDIATSIIKGNLKPSDLKSYIGFELGLNIVIGDKNVDYSILFEDKKIRIETIFCNGELVISKNSSDLLAELGRGWKYFSEEDPIEYYVQGVSVLKDQFELSPINTEISNIILLDTNAEYTIDAYNEFKLKWHVLMDDEEIKDEYRRLFPCLGFDITKVTEDLRYISEKDPEGTIITPEMRGTGFKKLVGILPFMIDSYMGGTTLLIPYFENSLHPSLRLALSKYYSSNSIRTKIGRMITY